MNKKPEGSMLPLPLGVYEPANRSRSNSALRAEFFRALHKIAPEVFKELAEEPFELFKEHGFGAGELMWTPELDPPLWASLQTWAEHWRLIDDQGPCLWLLEEALWILDRWRQDSADHDTRRLPPLESEAFTELSSLLWAWEEQPLNEVEQTIRLAHTFEWNPWWESRAAARLRIERILLTYLEHRLAEIEDLAQERKLIPIRQKNQAVHFEWLTYFQVAMLSYGQIAER